MNPAEVSTLSDTEVCVKRAFAAPAELVWRAYTEPALIRRWMLGPPGWSMPVCEMDVRIGGEYSWRWKNEEDGKEFGFYGKFTEVELQKKVVHTQFFDPGDLGGAMGDSLITVTLDEVDGKTVVTTVIAFKSKQDRDATLATGMTEGMELSYQRMDTLFASN